MEYVGKVYPSMYPPSTAIAAFHSTAIRNNPHRSSFTATFTDLLLHCLYELQLWHIFKAHHPSIQCKCNLDYVVGLSAESTVGSSSNYWQLYIHCTTKGAALVSSSQVEEFITLLVYSNHYCDSSARQSKQTVQRLPHKASTRTRSIFFNDFSCIPFFCVHFLMPK